MANGTAALRCAALIGPYLSGKTTLLEALLHAAGGTSRRGSVRDGNSVGDHTPEARARLNGAEEVVALEADDEIEIVGEAPEEPVVALDEPVAVPDEELPVAEAIEEPIAEAIAEDDPDMFILDGDEAEDFIIELDDDTDERKGRAGR